MMNWLLSSHIREPFCMNEYKSNSNKHSIPWYSFWWLRSQIGSMGLRYTVPFKITRICLSALTDSVTRVTQPVIVNTNNKSNSIKIVSLDIVLVDPLMVSFPKLKSVVSSVPSRRLTRWRVWHSHRQHKQTNPIQIQNRLVIFVLEAIRPTGVWTLCYNVNGTTAYCPI